MSQATLQRVHDRASKGRATRVACASPGPSRPSSTAKGVAPLPISVDAKAFRTAVSGEQGLTP